MGIAAALAGTSAPVAAQELGGVVPLELGALPKCPSRSSEPFHTST